jgi:hypothetical protein
MATPRGDGTERPAVQGLDAATTSLRPAPVVRQRALVTLTPSRGPVGVARTPPVEDPGQPSRGGEPLKALGGAARRLRARSRRPHVRRTLIGVAALAQTFILVSAIAWWTDQSSVEASTAVAPVSWTGVVHDVGVAGVNLRSTPQAVPGTSRDTAARGSRLALTCARTGDLVTDESGARSDMWLRTTDGLYVSLLYVDVPDRTSIVSCADASEDAPVLALDDPDEGMGAPDGRPAPESPLRPAVAVAGPDRTGSGAVEGSDVASRSGADSDGGPEDEQRPREPDAQPHQDPAAGSGDAVPGVPPDGELPAAGRPLPDDGADGVSVIDGLQVRVEHQTRAPHSPTSTRSRSTSPTATTTRNRDAVAVG